MLWLSDALGTRTLLWFGHGCSGCRMLWEHERDCDLSMDALVIGRTRNTNVVMVWACMLWLSYAVDNTNVIMVWAWMLWGPYALGTRTFIWFGHGCSGYRMHSEHARYYPPPPPPPTHPPNAKSETLQNRVRKSPRVHKQQSHVAKPTEPGHVHSSKPQSKQTTTMIVLNCKQDKSKATPTCHLDQDHCKCHHVLRQP